MIISRLFYLTYLQHLNQLMMTHSHLNNFQLASCASFSLVTLTPKPFILIVLC